MLAVSSVFKRSFKTNDGRVIFKLHETALIMSAIGAVHRFFSIHDLLTTLQFNSSCIKSVGETSSYPLKARTRCKSKRRTFLRPSYS